MAEAQFIDGLVAAGVLPADQAAAARQTLHAIASVDTHATANTVAYLLGSGLTPSQITGLINMTPPVQYDQFLQGFSLPSGQAPTGTSLAPLSSQLSLRDHGWPQGRGQAGAIHAGVGQERDEEGQADALGDRTLKKRGGRLKVTPAFDVPGLSSVPGVTLAESAKAVKVHRPHKR